MTYELSKERLEKIASWREKYGAGHNVILTAEEAEAMARALLAAHEQETVYQVCKEAGVWIDIEKEDMPHYQSNGEQLRILYTHPAPSIPAVPDIVGKLLAILDRHTVVLGWGEKPITLAELVVARDGSDELDACRAAMQPGSPVIPDGCQQWISDVIKYLEAGLESDGELEAQGSIDAKRLLAAAPKGV